MKTLLKGTLLVGLASVGVATAAWAVQANHGFNPAALDADGDGIISATELDTHADLLFSRSERHNDGSLSADELQVLHAMLPGGGAAMAHAPGRTPAPVNRQAFRAVLRGHAAQMDADRNGRLTVAELGAAMHGGQAH